VVWNGGGRILKFDNIRKIHQVILEFFVNCLRMEMKQQQYGEEMEQKRERNMVKGDRKNYNFLFCPFIEATRQILHSPLAIPELEFMRKWPNVLRAAKRQQKQIGGSDEIVVKLLNSSSTVMAETKAGEEEAIQQWQFELVAVTSYGSRQCASDEVCSKKIVIFLLKLRFGNGLIHKNRIKLIYKNFLLKK
jgi:hypothetical protein